MRLRRSALGGAASAAPPDKRGAGPRRAAALRCAAVAALLLWACGGAALHALRARRRSSAVHVSLRPPPPLTPLLPVATPPAAAPASCNARAGAEIHGSVVRAGAEAADAAACCSECAVHATCNAWVYCGDATRCGASLRQCWLKRVDDVGAAYEALAKGAFRSDAWISGLRLGLPAATYAAAAAANRAAALRAGTILLPSRRFVVGVRNSSGTVDVLSPRSLASADVAFSFLLPLQDAAVRLDGNAPLDRSGDGYHHLGDFTLRVRVASSAAAVTCSSVAAGQLAAEARSGSSAPQRGAVDEEWRVAREVPLARVAAGTRSDEACPLRVTRALEASPDGALTLSFEVANPGSEAVTLEDFGLSMPFDQLFAGRSLAQVAAACAFVEPFLGAGGGYVQATRATGDGPVLLLLPQPGTAFEAWRPLKGEDKMQPGFMYENSYQLMLHSAGFAAGEWAAAEQWNAPTAATLAAGATRSYGLRFTLAPSPADVEDVLLREGHPVVQLLPSGVIHADATSAAAVLLLPAAFDADAVRFASHPAAALSAGPCARVATADAAAPTRLRCALVPGTVPRDGARVRLTCELRCVGGGPPMRLTAHAFVAAPAPRLVAAFGAHAAGPAWLPPGANDPWHRDAAFFGWDARCNCTATQEPRVFMSGLSDEAGAAAALAVAMKQMGAPARDEITKLETFAHETLFQGDSKQRSFFLQSSADHCIRLSQLYWNDELNDPSSALGRAATQAAPKLAEACRGCWETECNWMICWTEEHSGETWRAYNYPHVTAIWWSLYRLARWHDPPLATARPWRWYLQRAADTAVAMYDCGGDPWTKAAGGGRGTAQWGLMVGSVFESLLTDLQREGWDTQAAALQRTVEKRMAGWLRMPFPYGSEFSWDSTGHEEIATWLSRFGHDAKAAATTRAVTAYVTLTPHWAFAGSARRWWDFSINGDGRGNERGFHHYGAALNSIPLFAAAMAARHDAWLWRLAAAANGGSLTNVRGDGSASMAWHADNDLLTRDSYSADYGIGFYGYAKQAGAYLSCDDASGGWLCIGCDMDDVQPPDAATSDCTRASSMRITPRDAFRRRIYLQPLGVLLQLDGGVITDATLTLGADGNDAAVMLRVRPALVGAAAALVTLRADGAHGDGSASRELRLTCAQSCTLEAAPFLPAAGEHVARLRFTPAQQGEDSTLLELRTVPPPL